MICPSCLQDDSVLVHRRGFRDAAASLFRLRPWRCMRCRRRFYARTIAREFMRQAHCPQCGNLKVVRLDAGSRAARGWRRLLQILGATAYSCALCGLKFHSFRTPSDLRSTELSEEAADPLSE